MPGVGAARGAGLAAELEQPNSARQSPSPTTAPARMPDKVASKPRPRAAPVDISSGVQEQSEPGMGRGHGGVGADEPGHLQVPVHLTLRHHQRHRDARG